MGTGLFTHIKEITQRQSSGYIDTLSESDMKSWNNYMITKFLSMNPHWVELVNDLQKYTVSMKPFVFYKLYINILPKSTTFLRYVKGKKSEKYEPWLVDLMIRYYECSKLQALNYLQILYSTDRGKFEIKYICEAFGEDPKRIKKLKLKV